MPIPNYGIGVPVIDHPKISIALLSIASIQWVVKAHVITPALANIYHVIYVLKIYPLIPENSNIREFINKC